ncbi:MAG: ferrous iron transport protein A [Magnetospirillum sp. WYHS-4]
MKQSSPRKRRLNELAVCLEYPFLGMVKVHRVEFESALMPPIPTPGTLVDLKPGEKAIIDRIDADVPLRRRLSALGVVKGVEISMVNKAPFGNPRTYSLLGYQLSLRNEDACLIVLQPAS